MQNQAQKDRLLYNWRDTCAVCTQQSHTFYPLALNGSFFLMIYACCKSPCATNLPSLPVFPLLLCQLAQYLRCLKLQIKDFLLLWNAFCTSVPLLKLQIPLTWWPQASNLPLKGFPSLLQYTQGLLHSNCGSWLCPCPIPASGRFLERIHISPGHFPVWST